MNPWAFLIILLGIIIVIVGVKGTQHNITSAITGVPHPGSAPNPPSSSTSSASTTSASTNSSGPTTVQA